MIMKIKTKLSSYLQAILFLMVALFLPTNAFAWPPFTVDGIIYDLNDDDYFGLDLPGVRVIGCTLSGNVVIPSTVTHKGYTYTVTAIYEILDANPNITGISIPNTVIAMGHFYEWNNLSHITVASDNPRYDSRDNCNAVIETASNTLINGCKSTVIPNSVTTIGTSAFDNSSGLTEITIPNSVTTICEAAFANCPDLVSVDIPSSVTEIGADAFLNSKITEDQHGIVYVGNWVVGYKNDLPGDCIIKNGTIGIASNTFNNRYYADSSTEPPFTNLIIPNSVLYIGDDVFYYTVFGFGDNPPTLSPIKTIVIGESVKTIGSHSFYTGSQSRYNDHGTLIDGDVDLQSITCLAKVPPQTSDAFASHILDNPIYGWYETDYVIYHRVPLYVPMESVEAYKSDEEWGRFQTIVGIEVRDPSDVNGDGEVTIADVNCIVHEILYLYITPNNLEYDVNGDGEVTIADVNAVIDAIIGN